MDKERPVFAVCGYSGSGKTTLLERVLPRLIQRGLSVAVVKHDVHGIDRDPSSKDSDRLFRVGADVVVHGPGETLARTSHVRDTSLEATLDCLLPRYDLVLLEGFKHWSGRKAWLLRNDETAPPTDIGPCDPILRWEMDRTEILEGALVRFLREQVERAPVFACVLIGGASKRMGRAKHLLPLDDGTGETWLHRSVRVLQPFCQQVVLSGRGEIPSDLRHLPHLPDSPGVNGPLAGLLSAMRWAPRADWLLSACDLPFLSPEAVAWLLTQRRPGVWAAMPRVSERRPLEPLLAWYGFRCRDIIDLLAAAETPALRHVVKHPKCRAVVVPSVLVRAWRDVDTPEGAAFDYAEGVHHRTAGS